MCETECDLLRVNVPVGFLLPAPQEIVVSVDRPTDQPLSIRLRLIPAEPRAEPARPQAAMPFKPSRRLMAWGCDDGYPHPEYGGGD
jgi:hypothetical protein